MTLYQQLSEKYATASKIIKAIDTCNDLMKKDRNSLLVASLINHRNKLLETRIEIMKLHDSILLNEL